MGLKEKQILLLGPTLILKANQGKLNMNDLERRLIYLKKEKIVTNDYKTNDLIKDTKITFTFKEI
jgi:hypothetical protein